MGMFSWDCKACGHAALSHGATDKGLNDWMKDVVILSEDGSRAFGEYDGYGRAGMWDASEDGHEPCLYHRACWELAGKPEYTGPSKGSRDQGWFFADGDHDMLDPRTTQFMAPEVIADKIGRLAAERDGFKRGRAFVEADSKTDKGTYMALFQQRVSRARDMTLEARMEEFGYDILEYADAKYDDLY